MDHERLKRIVDLCNSEGITYSRLSNSFNPVAPSVSEHVNSALTTWPCDSQSITEACHQRVFSRTTSEAIFAVQWSLLTTLLDIWSELVNFVKREDAPCSERKFSIAGRYLTSLLPK